MRISVLAFFFLFGIADGKKFKFRNEPIRTKISLQHLNRITVTGDKIDSILGLSEAFFIEKNDKTGDAFIRPTEENGYNDISLNIVTASGETQDLILLVVDGDPQTIELETKPKPEAVENEDVDFSLSDYENNLATSMRNAVLKDGIKIDITVDDRLFHGFVAKFEKAYKVDELTCLVFVVTSDIEGECREKMFAKAGDLALSLSRLKVSKDVPAKLYVLRR